MRQKGDRGPHIKALQRRLEACSYLLPRYGADGILGDETLGALANFELEHRLPPSSPGMVGELTLDELQHAPRWARGIDVSRYQGEIHWPAVKASGVSFVFARATLGSSEKDGLFASNWKGIKAAGLLRGAYHVWRPELDSQQQVEHFFQQTGALQPGDLPPVLDVEGENKVGRKEANRRLQLMIDWVLERFGVLPIVYTSKRICDTWELGVGSECLVWLARYYALQGFRRQGPPLPAQWSRWCFWQTGYGPGLPGVRADVDRNFFQGNNELLLGLRIV